MRLAPSVVDSPYHQQLALEAAQQVMVLLQNNGSILPISKSAKVAVIGPNSNVTQTLLSNYHGQRCHDGGYDCMTNPYDAIMQKGIDATWAFGCAINSDDTSGFAEAITNAKDADIAIVFLGIDQSIESEGNDRVTIDLPGVQLQLIQEIVATGTPTVVVLINGGALAIEWIKANVPGILEAFYPGEMGSFAIADVLFGDYNPGGKMAYTILPAEYVNQIPLTDMNMTDGPGRTYRYYTGTPIWPFGWGLSYTTFTIDWESNSMKPKTFATNDDLSQVYFRAKVTNTGSIAGDEVVQAFITGTGPIKQLFGFQRVSLQPGESKEVFFAGTAKIFSQVNTFGDRIVKEGTYGIILTNGVDQHLHTKITLTGHPQVLFSLPEKPLF